MGDPSLNVKADLVFADESHDWKTESINLQPIPVVVVGEGESENLDPSLIEGRAYLSRPIQWTEFKDCLAGLDLDQQISETSEQVTGNNVSPPEESSNSDAHKVDQIEPVDLSETENKSESVNESKEEDKLSLINPGILEIDDDQTSEPITDADQVQSQETPENTTLGNDWALGIDETESLSVASDSEESDSEVQVGLELDQLSSDYLSISQSEMVRVVDDVKQFYTEQEGQDLGAEPVILVTDEESSVASSVLILETDASEVWDADELDAEIVGDSVAVFDEEQEIEKREGVPLRVDDVYWREDKELIAKNSSLLFVKPQRQMVYSRYSPGDWLKAYLDSDLSTLPLPANWRPKVGFHHYPQDYLIWVDIAGRQNERLSKSIDLDLKYLLTTWPKFDLVYQSNDLLKYATRLFLKPASLPELLETVKPEQKRLVTGFINACYKNKQLVV